LGRLFFQALARLAERLRVARGRSNRQRPAPVSLLALPRATVRLRQLSRPHAAPLNGAKRRLESGATWRGVLKSNVNALQQRAPA
jgi:hypothetical protein